MANIFQIGILLVLFTIFSSIQESEADGKKKRIIIKVPQKIMHIYHHRTKKVHIHKKIKPKPKPKETIHIHVEEKIVPHKSWKPIEWSKGKKKSKKPYQSNWHQGYANFGDDFGGEAVGSEDDYSYSYGNYDDKGKLADMNIDDEPWVQQSNLQEEKKLWKKPGKKVRKTKSKKKRKSKPKPIYDDYDYDKERDVWPERREHPSWRQWQPKNPVNEMGSQNWNQWQMNKPVKESEENVDFKWQSDPQQAGTGYRNQVEELDGKSVGYQSHVGHSSGSSSPSSSFQSVTFGKIGR